MSRALHFVYTVHWKLVTAHHLPKPSADYKTMRIFTCRCYMRLRMVRGSSVRERYSSSVYISKSKQSNSLSECSVQAAS